MKNQALLSSKDKSKKLKCRLLQFLFGTLRVNLLHSQWPKLYGFCGSECSMVKQYLQISQNSIRLIFTDSQFFSMFLWSGSQMA